MSADNNRSSNNILDHIKFCNPQWLACLHEKEVSMSLPCGLQSLMWCKMSFPDMLLSADIVPDANRLVHVNLSVSTRNNAGNSMSADNNRSGNNILGLTTWAIFVSVNCMWQLYMLPPCHFLLYKFQYNCYFNGRN